MPRRPPILAALTIAACAAPPSPPPAVGPAPVAAPTAVPAPEPEAPAVVPAPPAEPPPPPRPRLWANAYPTRIYGRPKVDRRLIGLLRYGTSVTLRSTELVRGEGCKGGFYAIEPRGYVCNDRAITLTPSQGFLDAAAAAVGVAGPLPYKYAYSDGAPMYRRIPTQAEQKRVEAAMGPSGDKRPPKKKFASSYMDLATLDVIEPDGPVPSLLPAPSRGLVKETLPAASMLSFSRAFSVEGRTFLLSADQSLVPADRVRVFHPSTFHGTRIGEDVRFPIAWMRRVPRPQYRRLASGAFEKTGASWPAKSFVRLNGVSVEEGLTRLLETLERDADGGALWVSDKDATVVEQAKRLANGVKPGQKWIVVSITRGTLVAYEGLTPVYATLMSPGRGGVPIPGHDNVQDSTTPLGTYNVTFKDKATTMSPDKPGGPRTQWIADVPHTLYFDPPFALHAAFWHDRFGEPTSAGCINVSPIDAEVLFKWSDPQVPEEWEGATGAGAPENGAMTAIVVRR